MKKKNRKNYLFIVFLAFMFSACTNARADRNYEYKEVIEMSNFLPKNDPWETLNRRVYYFNYLVDKTFLIPVVNTYKFITPDPVEKGVSNFFKNTGYLDTAVNSTLQLKGRKTMRAIARFTINSILGLGGLFDVASKMGMPKPYEDFGLTLSNYGVPRGPYLILPFLGPSYLRDAFGMALGSSVRHQIDPYRKMNLFSLSDPKIMSLMMIDKRKNIKFKYYQTGSPFEYEYIRFLYRKYRTLQEKTRVNIF